MRRTWKPIQADGQLARERIRRAQEVRSLRERRAARCGREVELLHLQRFDKRDRSLNGNRFNRRGKQRRTIDFDLRKQRTERAVLRVVPWLCYSRAIGRRFFCSMTVAAATGLSGSRRLHSARGVTAGEQSVERVPKRSERAECNQRDKRQAAIHSGK